MDHQPEDRDFLQFRELLRPKMALYRSGNFNEEDIVEIEPLYTAYKSKQAFLSQFPNERSRQKVLGELQSIDRRRKQFDKITAPMLKAVRKTILEDNSERFEPNSWEEQLKMRGSEDTRKPRPR